VSFRSQQFLVKCDAEVIKDHVEKDSEAKEPELIKYLRKCERWKGIFGDSPLSTCQEKAMAKPTSSKRRLPGGGDASGCILRDPNCSLH
jgi:hypothetical protein